MEEYSPIQKKRTVLISLSRKAKLLREIKAERAKTDKEAEYWATRTVNDMLFMILYNPKNEREFNTFDQWRKTGKRVKKGEKAVFIWGMPRKATAKVETKTEQTLEEIYKFWPICFLFSDLQVN
jgi:hypothetical protein